MQTFFSNISHKIILQVHILNKGLSFQEPLDIKFREEGGPLFLIFSNPAINNYKEYGSAGSMLNLYFGLRSLNNTERVVSGNIILSYRGKVSNHFSKYFSKQCF